MSSNIKFTPTKKSSYDSKKVTNFYLGDEIGHWCNPNGHGNMKIDWKPSKKGQKIYADACKCVGGVTGREVTSDFEHRICSTCGKIEN